MNIEIRNNEDGTLDEIILKVDGECIFHLEQMSDKTWWMGLGSPTLGDYKHCTLHSKKKIKAFVEDA